MRNSLLLFFALLSFTANTQAQDSNRNSEQVKQAIQTNLQQMQQAMMDGDAGELSQHFSEDAVLKFPQQPLLRGREAVEQAHQQMIDKGIAVKPRTQEVQVSGSMAFEMGTYELVTETGQKLDEGYYATLWKKERGEWKISRDIISSTKTPPADN